VKYLGVRVCLLILPVIALGGYGLLLFFPVLSVVRWAKTAENATDYSLQNTVRNMLWLPTSRQEKYKAKQFVDTFCVRVGDMLSAAVVFMGTRWAAAELAHFAAFNLVLVAAWLAVAVLIGRQYRRLTADQTA
jgi:AAA family ATP:ADP antiporter